MARLLNLRGRRFGILTVVARADDIVFGSGRRQAAWACVCDCGAYATVAANNLRSGNTESCGCLKRAPRGRINLVGRRFGRLAVAGYSHTTQRGQAVWHCTCDCGARTTCRATALLRGKVKSCGCYRAEGRFHSGIGPKRWAFMVKDGRCCLRCGSTTDLHAHHIIPVSADPSLARSMFNGECLCERCHMLFHAVYGKESAGIADLAAFCQIGDLEAQILRTLIYASGRQDIEKAIHELQLLLQLRYPEGA